MGLKINKGEIINYVAEAAHISILDATNAINALFEDIEYEVKSGNEVNIMNFGIFKPFIKEERIGTDPKTHEKINIPLTKTVIFKPSKNLKNKLNNK